MIAPDPIYATAPLINFYFDFEIISSRGTFLISMNRLF